MICFDVTKAGRTGHRSGLQRVSARLGGELGAVVTPVRWTGAGWVESATGRALAPGPADWLVTAELFSEEERPGFTAWLDARTCRRAAIFHDAIPLQWPQITWPQSVARHPAYLKLLAGFDHVWAVSAASRADLLGYWRWLGLETVPPVATLALGADFDGTARAGPAAPRGPVLLCVGILEPRKQQEFLLEVCDALWTEGLAFTLHLVGRVNPHFGRPIAERIRRLQRAGRAVQHHPAADDAALNALYAVARATVFPTRAEGCGLPLLESLWRGVPCVCSDLPVLRENADAGGCVAVPAGDAAAWGAALRRALTDDAWITGLAEAAATRSLPTWRQTAAQVTAALA